MGLNRHLFQDKKGSAFAVALMIEFGRDYVWY